jgi:hypothetical protein
MEARKEEEMSKFEIGDRVQLKISYAKWHLDHPEIYGENSESSSFEEETQLHLVCCLGEPVYGKIIRYGNMDCFHVKWRVGNLSATYYVDPKDLIK